MDPEHEIQIARPLAPEDLRPGQHVSVLHVVVEREAAPWECVSPSATLQPTKLRVPPCGSLPVEVVDICLPFVLVKSVRGKCRTLDVRRFRLARVSDDFARRVISELEKQRQLKDGDAAAAAPSPDAPEDPG